MRAVQKNILAAGAPLLFALALSSGLVASSTASAQRSTQQVLELNRRAMDAYTNLEIDEARRLLEQALSLAERDQVTGAPLARTRVNLGVVFVAGLRDNAAGLQHFVAALRADPQVQLDPLTSTPDIQQVFNQARQRASGGGQPD